MTAPFLYVMGWETYRFLPPFFLPPLAAFFAIVSVPPFSGCCAALVNASSKQQEGASTLCRTLVFSGLTM